MKLITKYTSMLLGVTALLILQSCSKSFLERPPLSQVTTGNFYLTDEEVLAATAPLYNIVWFDYNDKAFLAFGEARGGNLQSNDRTNYIQFSVSATDQNTLLAGYKSFYKIVSQSNITMRNIVNSKGSISENAKNTALGECHFMRGMAYYFLVSNWGAVPIIYNNIDQLGDSVRRNSIKDVSQFIINDFKKAVEYLPEVPNAQGRLSKWSAKGMLAKMYLTFAGLDASVGSRNQAYLDSARIFAKDVIYNSGLGLFPNYPGLFTSENNNSSNNNPESLFALQWMPYSNPWGINNSFQAYMAYTPDITQTGAGWGAAQGVSADVVKYFMDNPSDSIRRKAICMFDGDHYSNLMLKDNGLDYEVTTISNVKKYVVGSPADNGGMGGFMTAYVNTYMLRLAEIYLIYAEAIMGNNASSSDAEALKYFNLVRKRAGMSEKNSINFEDIFQEKRVETLMEGGAWYEILRWYYFAPQQAMDYVAQQDKGTYTIEYIDNTYTPRQYNVTYTSAYYSVTPQTVYLPLPESELIKAPSLAEPPVPFDFGNVPNY